MEDGYTSKTFFNEVNAYNEARHPCIVKMEEVINTDKGTYIGNVQLWFHEKNCQKKFGWKTRENVGDVHILVVDIFDYPRKIVKFCQNWIFGQKFDFSNSV